MLPFSCFATTQQNPAWGQYDDLQRASPRNLLSSRVQNVSFTGSCSFALLELNSNWRRLTLPKPPMPITRTWDRSWSSTLESYKRNIRTTEAIVLMVCIFQPNCWLSSQLLNFNPSHNLLGAPQEQLLPQFRTNLEITMEPAPLANDRSRLPRTQLSLSTRALPQGTATTPQFTATTLHRVMHLRTQNSDGGCTRFLLSSRQAKWRLDAARKPKKLTSNKRVRSPKWPCLER